MKSTRRINQLSPTILYLLVGCHSFQSYCSQTSFKPWSSAVITFLTKIWVEYDLFFFKREKIQNYIFISALCSNDKACNILIQTGEFVMVTLKLACNHLYHNNATGVCEKAHRTHKNMIICTLQCSAIWVMHMLIVK